MQKRCLKEHYFGAAFFYTIEKYKILGFIPHVRCPKTPTSRPELIQKGQSGKRHLNARLVQGHLGHTLVVLTFRVKSIPRNEVSLYRIRKATAFAKDLATSQVFLNIIKL
ncbi:MAG: hypothetical protein ACFWT6_14740 [Virgibacillus proomii]|jgi:hypothetical protein